MSEAAGCTPQELMVAVAAREIRDGELVFVGMRLPILAYGVARSTHAPRARALYELGLMRDRPPAAFLGTMGDPPNVVGALWATRLSNVMALMAQGEVDLGFIGGAEVDRFGNLNTSYVGDPRRPATKLPGSGGGADIAVLSRRWVTLMSHERRRLRDRVSYVTSPGHGDGAGWRERHGLPGGGPAAIVTTMAVLRFPPGGGEAYLASVHPGHTVDEVRERTGWDLRVPAGGAGVTPPPTPDELAEMRRLDPDGFWTRRG